MITLEDLKQRFPLQNVPPYGECVVVPGKDFDPDWEAMLDDAGYGCVFTDVNRQPVTLVLTIKRHGESRKTVYEPRAKPQKVSVKSAMKGPAWSQEDEDRLIKRVSELKGSLEGKIRILIKEFQGRSVNGLLQKFKKLAKAGRALPGKRGRPKKAVSLVLQKDLDKALENVCLDCGLPKDLCCCDEEKKESLRKEVRIKYARHLEEKVSPSGLMVFKTYCRRCRDRRHVEESEVWSLCPVCGGPLIIWDVEEVS